VLLSLPIREILPATPRARIVRFDLDNTTFDYTAGQAVLVGSRSQPRRRPYSIAAAPEDARREGWLELLVGVDDRGVAGEHLRLVPGARIDIEGPVGAFTFPADPEEQRFVFIAGGTGIAPLRAMLRHALTIPHRDVGLYYSARTPDDFAYEAELTALARERRIELKQTVTRQVDDSWTGARGRLGHAELQPLIHGPATLCFICGPPGLVEGVSKILQDLGISRPRIKVEEW